MTPSPSAFERALAVVLDKHMDPTYREFAQAFMQAFLSDADVRNEVAKGIANHRGELVSTREMAAKEMADGACKALQRMMEK